MDEHTYKVIELIGSSKTSMEHAVNNALARASGSVRNSRWFEITQIRGEIENNGVAYWQVGLKLGFTIESRQQDKASRAAGTQVPASAKYRCKVCGYIYDPQKGDPDNGVNPGISFADLPDDWVCPECGVNKDQFEKV